ncbi:hypothetical protein FZEAL_9606 [Fusarium zealandicum]|uniref:Zn(2)-C6 fungal-type domain-containing protein n=1 Tax=Fusarium zealandicum TaxID=1053134 RepID=A0A8H4XEP8_9HYPO|nr:hypothetical protein FZEAL_9606 [Fusarium zealandicum]
MSQALDNFTVSGPVAPVAPVAVPSDLTSNLAQDSKEAGLGLSPGCWNQFLSTVGIPGLGVTTTLVPSASSSALPAIPATNSAAESEDQDFLMHDCVSYVSYDNLDQSLDQSLDLYSEFTITPAATAASISSTPSSLVSNILGHSSLSTSLSTSGSTSLSPSLSTSLSTSLSPSLSTSLSTSGSTSLSTPISTYISPRLSPSPHMAAAHPTVPATAARKAGGSRRTPQAQKGKRVVGRNSCARCKRRKQKCVRESSKTDCLNCKGAGAVCLDGEGDHRETSVNKRDLDNAKAAFFRARCSAAWWLWSLETKTGTWCPTKDEVYKRFEAQDNAELIQSLPDFASSAGIIIKSEAMPPTGEVTCLPADLHIPPLGNKPTKAGIKTYLDDFRIQAKEKILEYRKVILEKYEAVKMDLPVA